MRTPGHEGICGRVTRCRRRDMARVQGVGVPRARERLILHYSPLVKFVAGRVAAGLPQNVEQADLVGLRDLRPHRRHRQVRPRHAGSSSRRTRSVASRAPSSTSSARSTGCRVRSGRRRARSSAPTRSSRTSCAARPTDREVAAELGMSEDDLAATMSQISFVGIVALDELLSAGERSSGATLGDTVADTVNDPVERVREGRAAARSRRRDQPDARP